MSCPFVMPPQRERTLHFRTRSYYSATISSFRDFILFTEVCHSSSDETRWNRLVVGVHYHTSNITVEATNIIEMNNSIKQIQRARLRVDDSQNHLSFHDLPIVNGHGL